LFQSTATQNDADGHEIPETGVVSAKFVAVQAEEPPVGSVEVSTYPPSFTAAQKFVEGHDMP
jgi:hypothetical protein